jgi:hypothetical protein
LTCRASGVERRSATRCMRSCRPNSRNQHMIMYSID